MGLILATPECNHGKLADLDVRQALADHVAQFASWVEGLQGHA